MSFDVTFLPTHLSAPRLVVSSAHSSPSHTEVLSPLEMSEAQLEAIRNVVAAHGASVDESGSAVIDVAGARVALMGLGPSGASATVWGNLDASCKVLFAIATAGELAMKMHAEEAFTTTREARERADSLASMVGPCAFVPDAADLSRRIAVELHRGR